MTIRTAAMLTASALAWALAGTTTPANAEPLDHMACFRVSDPIDTTVAVDLATLPFGVDTDCVVSVKAREICVPQSASVIASHASDLDPTIEGDNLGSEHLCYRIECPPRQLDSAQVTDRFGTRRVRVDRAKTICVPMHAGE